MDAKRFSLPWLSALLALVLMAALPVAMQATESSDDPVHWSGQMSSGQWLTVKDINGKIEATGTSGNTAEVIAEKSGRDADLVRVSITSSSQGVLVCVVYPDDSGDSEGCGHHHSDREIHARVDFTIKVPAGIHLRADNVNGSVTANDLDANAEASSVNGSVSVSTKSWAQAKSVNGSVSVEMGASDWPDELALDSVNGNVELTAPSGLNADVHLQTMNGTVRSDFAYTVNGGSVSGRGSRIEATIGSGGRTLKMKSVNGSIELRKGEM